MNKSFNNILGWGASFLGGFALGYGIIKLLTSKNRNTVNKEQILVTDPLLNEVINPKALLSDDSETKEQIHELDLVENVVIIPKEPLSDDSMITEPIHTSEPDEENVIIIKLPIINESEEEEPIEPTEPIELGETKPQATKARSRKELPPVEVIMQMKEMLDNGATYKTIIETVGSEYELKYPYQVRNAINSLAQ